MMYIFCKGSYKQTGTEKTIQNNEGKARLQTEGRSVFNGYVLIMSTSIRNACMPGFILQKPILEF